MHWPRVKKRKVLKKGKKDRPTNRKDLPAWSSLGNHQRVLVAQGAWDEQYGEWNENWWSEEARAKGQLSHQNESGNLQGNRDTHRSSCHGGRSVMLHFDGTSYKAAQTRAPPKRRHAQAKSTLFCEIGSTHLQSMHLFSTWNLHFCWVHVYKVAPPVTCLLVYKPH